MQRLTIAGAMLLASTAANAVPYTLPTSPDQPYSQLQTADGISQLCATWVDDGACDVDPGEYRLVRYDTDWTGISEQISVGEESEQPFLISASEICDISDEGTVITVDEQSTAQCTATCPAGTVAIATTCNLSDVLANTASLAEIGNGSCTWRVADAEFYFAGATCAREDLFD